MSHRLNGRVVKLESQISPPQTRRSWQICKQPDETLAQACLRHGITPGAYDHIIVLLYGCPCRHTP